MHRQLIIFNTNDDDPHWSCCSAHIIERANAITH